MKNRINILKRIGYSILFLLAISGFISILQDKSISGYFYTSIFYQYSRYGKLDEISQFLKDYYEGEKEREKMLKKQRKY